MAFAHRLVRPGLALVAAALFPIAALAGESIVSTQVTLLDSVYGNAGPDSVLAGGSIESGDSTNIGSTVLLLGEFINVNTTSLVYNVLGGILPCPIANYSCTGYGTGAVYTFSDIQFSNPQDYIENVTAVLTNATYASGPGFSFTGNSVTMDVGYGQLGTISNNNGNQDFGTVELDLTIGQHPVPLPATLPILSSGLAMCAWLAGRRRRQTAV